MPATLSVSQFVEFLNVAMATAVFPEGADVLGEVAEYRVSQDRWIWFLLKDKDSVVPCFATVWQLRTPLENGMQVRVHGHPKVHAKSGKFSLNVERVELVGEGALRRAYEILRRRLADEGLFAPERKRPIPRFPERIGLITSPEAAAYTDFLRILGNRWGGVEVLLAPVRVQGRDAVADIVGAFRWFNAHPDAADVLVLTRGGGSLEDLQAFNTEETARAVFSSRIPVIVGVGHERDETLADQAADLRASTPSNAAELAVPDRRQAAQAVDAGAMTASFEHLLASCRSGLADSGHRLESRFAARIAAFNHLLRDFSVRLAWFSGRASAAGERAAGAARRLDSAFRGLTARLLAGVDARARLIEGQDPQRLLSRGYAIVRSGGQTIRDSSAVAVGSELEISLYRGQLKSKVTAKK